MRTSMDMDIPLVLDRSAEEALHVQIAGGLRAAVGAGLLAPGTRLPSTRTLASHLGVARGTVLAAFELLDGEGYLEGRTGSGTYVTRTLPSHVGAGAPRGPGSGRPASTARAARRLSSAVDLRPGRPDIRGLNTPEWRRAWRAAAMQVPADQPDPAGEWVLREQLAEHLRSGRGLRCTADDVLITTGTNDGLASVMYACDLPGRRVGVENPGYPATRHLVTAVGAAAVGVPVDRDGLRVDRLPHGDLAPGLAVVTPSHQYPLGGRLPVDRRLALLDWAVRHDALVAEDDYDGEFRYDLPPLPSLATLDTTGRVVHIGTFSKTLTPSLRLGYLVVPAWLRPSVLRVRAALASPASGLAQLAVAAFLHSGGFRRHLARSRREYRRRRIRLTELIEPYRPALNLHGLDAGLHAVLELPAGTDAAAVTDAAARDGVLVAPLGEYTVSPRPDLPPAIVLGYGDATDDDLTRAIDTIAAHLALARSAAG